jgi:hypothetical protein
VLPTLGGQKFLPSPAEKILKYLKQVQNFIALAAQDYLITNALGRRRVFLFLQTLIQNCINAWTTKLCTVLSFTERGTLRRGRFFHWIARLSTKST